MNKTKKNRRHHIIRKTLLEGVGVQNIHVVFPGYIGQIDAPFDEASEGNPVYEIYELTSTHDSNYFDLPGLRVSVCCNPSRMIGVSFSTPDGAVTLTECGAFHANPVEQGLRIPKDTSLDEELEIAETFTRAVCVPRLLTNVCKAVFAPASVPDHWKLEEAL